jgi:hypothetical protein
LFADSEYMTRSAAKARLQEIASSLIRPGTLDRVVLVGQSVAVDLAQLRQNGAFQLELEPLIGQGFQVFDTHELGACAASQGAVFAGNMRLASLALNAGIENRYHTRRETTPKQAARDVLKFGTSPLVRQDLVACHNASNDAAYALITMLLLALRWKDLVKNSTAEGRFAARVWRHTGHLASSMEESTRDLIAALPEQKQSQMLDKMMKGQSQMLMETKKRKRARSRARRPQRPPLSWGEWFWKIMRAFFRRSNPVSKQRRME